MSVAVMRGLHQSLSETKDYLKQLNCEIQDCMKPKVVIQLRPSKTSFNVMNLEIANVGNSPAYDISCHFDPDIEYPLTKGGLRLSQLPVFNNLSIIIPHEKVILVFANLIEYLNDPSKPKAIAAVLEYKDERGTRLETKINLKVDELEKISYTRDGDIADVATVLINIVRQLDRIEHSLRDLRDVARARQSH